MPPEDENIRQMRDIDVIRSEQLLEQSKQGEECESISAGTATPHETLLEELLDSRISKSEREHVAAKEITRLREELKRRVSFTEYALAQMAWERAKGEMRSVVEAFRDDEAYTKLSKLFEEFISKVESDSPLA